MKGLKAKNPPILHILLFGPVFNIILTTTELKEIPRVPLVPLNPKDSP